VTLPLTISLCQTNPMTGQCTSSIGPSVTTTINANATPTFAIFATARGQVPFVPQTNRIFVGFSDATGTVRGSTSDSREPSLMCPVVRKTQHRRSPRLLFAPRKARWLKSRRGTSEEARCKDQRSGR
jgi:hypothetical protein